MSKVAKPKKEELSFSRVGFVKEYLQMKGISVAEIASLVGKEPATVASCFFKDNMRVSFARELIDAAGGTLSFCLRKSDGNIHNVDNITDGIPQYRARGSKIVNIAFLYTFLCEMGFKSSKEIGKAIGLSDTIGSYWFQQDEIDFARLFMLVEKLNATLYVSIREKHSPVKDELLKAKCPKVVLNFDYQKVQNCKCDK